MAKKERKVIAETVDETESRAGKILSIRCPAQDQTDFLKAALEEGFSDRTAWMLYHLRRQAKKTIREAGGE